MELSTNNIRCAVQRQLAEYLTAAFPDDVPVLRRWTGQPPEHFRATVLPGRGQADTKQLFLGESRATRDEEFTVRVMVEGIVGDDQDELEDAVDALVGIVEDVVAENPRLGDMAGLMMFGVECTTQDYDVSELTAGVLWRGVEITISAQARYD